VVDVEGFEGPLDLLLALARTQKVDLAKISVLALAQQYLDFISEARRLRLEIAADYLVMAAWLAFLKSKLLLPAEPSDEGEPSGAELAALLAFRLKRLHAMREVSAQLMTRKRLGRDVFARGLPQPIHITRKSVYDANVYDLLKAYSQQRQRTATLSLRMRPRTVWSLKEARGELERLLGMNLDWAPLDRLLSEFLVEPELRRTALASGFTATLEMTREGKLEIRQSKSFAPLLIRRRERAARS
jgi:segregation and condensation protein A